MPILFSHLLGTTDRALCPKILGESKHSLAFVILRSLLHSIFLHAHERRKQKRKNNRTVRIRAVPSLVIGECSMPAFCLQHQIFLCNSHLDHHVEKAERQTTSQDSPEIEHPCVPVCSEGSQVGERQETWVEVERLSLASQVTGTEH